MIPKGKIVKITDHPSASGYGKVFKCYKDKYLIIKNDGELIQVNKDQIKEVD